MAEAFQEDAEGVYVVGPVRQRDRWAFLCPECDDDLINDVGDAPRKQCTTAWLQTRELTWDERTWVCFDDPFEGDTSVLHKTKRYFHYRAIAVELQAHGRRVELPGCVQERINATFKESEVGFIPGCEPEA